MFRILAADDDQVQLDLRGMLFESAGHEVVRAFSVRQTAHEMKRGQFHLVVMDLRFPNAEGKGDAREGMELIRQIRELNSTVPIIVLSGWPEDIEGQPEERMVSRVMLKPVRPDALLEAARELLGA